MNGMVETGGVEIEGMQKRRGEKHKWSPIRGEVEDGTHITLKRVETSSWRMEAICEEQKSFF
jgi:hypothetical protein